MFKSAREYYTSNRGYISRLLAHIHITMLAFPISGVTPDELECLSNVHTNIQQQLDHINNTTLTQFDTIHGEIDALISETQTQLDAINEEINTLSSENHQCNRCTQHESRLMHQVW